jgi:hypothetical protein
MIHSLNISADHDGRLRRRPVVALLIVGLLLSLLHCGACEPGAALPTAQAATVIVIDQSPSIGQSTPPGVPDHQLPCHAGHCLSHVVEQATMVVAARTDIAFRSLAPGPVLSPPSRAASTPFKPPRA